MRFDGLKSHLKILENFLIYFLRFFEQKLINLGQLRIWVLLRILIFSRQCLMASRGVCLADLRDLVRYFIEKQRSNPMISRINELVPKPVQKHFFSATAESLGSLLNRSHRVPQIFISFSMPNWQFSGFVKVLLKTEKSLNVVNRVKKSIHSFYFIFYSQIIFSQIIFYSKIYQISLLKCNSIYDYIMALTYYR